MIEEELEILYDAYYEELESFANCQPASLAASCKHHPERVYQEFQRQRASWAKDLGRSRSSHRCEYDDDEYDDDESAQSDYSSGSIFEFGNSLTVKGK